MFIKLMWHTLHTPANKTGPEPQKYGAGCCCCRSPCSAKHGRSPLHTRSTASRPYLKVPLQAQAAKLPLYQATWVAHQLSGCSRTIFLVISEYGSSHSSVPIMGTQPIPGKYQVVKMPCAQQHATAATHNSHQLRTCNQWLGWQPATLLSAVHKTTHSFNSPPATQQQHSHSLLSATQSHPDTKPMPATLTCRNGTYTMMTITAMLTAVP